MKRITKEIKAIADAHLQAKLTDVWDNPKVSTREEVSDFGIDEIWENCCIHYDNFVNSKFNNEFKSEYDCISDYVEALMESYQS